MALEFAFKSILFVTTVGGLDSKWNYLQGMKKKRYTYSTGGGDEKKNKMMIINKNMMMTMNNERLHATTIIRRAPINKNIIFIILL